MSMGNKDFRDQLGKFRLDSLETAHWPSHLENPRSLSHSHSHALSHTQLSDSISPDGSSTRTKRVSTACDFCRKRKKKCDFRYPNCSACTRAGVRCTIPLPGPQVATASVPRDQLENLQKRVRWLEEVVRLNSGTSVTNIPTGTQVDVEENHNLWFQVPTMIATGMIHTLDISMPSPVGSVRSPATAGLAGSDSSTGVGTNLPDVGEIFRNQLEQRRPSVAYPNKELRVIRLSSLEEAEQVAAQYFDSMGYQYPFLSRPDFMANLQLIYADRAPLPAAHNSYHIVIAISLLIGSGDALQAAEFYHVSQETLPFALQNEDLQAIRALLCLALYTMFATTGPSIWHILGTTMRLATSLGLHKARVYADHIEEEMSKRAFWSLYNLDRLIASTLGRPLGIADEDITASLPRELNDDGSEVPGASTMTIPLQVIYLRRIFSRIYRYLYSNIPQPPPQEVATILGRFRSEVDEWRNSAPLYPAALLYSTSYYDYLYYTTLLLMYRPSSRNPTPDAISIVSCGDSSIQVIRSYWDSYSAGKLKWIWLTLSQIYFAGITILWCLEQNARSVRNIQTPTWDPADDEIRHGIQAVVVLLAEFGKRRPGVHQLAETFRHQSTMIFSQMAYQQQQQQQPPPPPPPLLMRPQLPDMSAPAPHPHSMPLTPVLDDILLVDGSGVSMIDAHMTDQLLLSYNWFQEEMSSYYTL